MTDSETVSLMNELIATSRDGEKGFAQAARETDSTDLRVIFLAASQRCAAAARELQNFVVGMGGKAEDGGSVAGALHRGWVNVRTAISKRDDLAVLEECERGEDFAKRRYAEALTRDVPEAVLRVLERQYEGVLQNHDRILALRDERK